MPLKMIVRVRGEGGTKRIEIEENDTIRNLVLKVNQLFSPSKDHGLFFGQNKSKEIEVNHLDVPLSQLPLRHGDMLYLELRGLTQASSSTELLTSSSQVTEDDVDLLLSQKDGKIQRPRNPHLCHHSEGNKCLNCAPLEPFDTAYLESLDPPIKFLSFHSYIRKLRSGIDKGKFLNLEDLSCKVKPGCTDHAPWPHGICTKCQPNAVTLARQNYRHVDNIMFEDGQIVDRFIDAWRKSGRQRVGFLYGRYEEYKDVPLGIRAQVSAIYEPPQISSAHGNELLEDIEEDSVNTVAKALGLVRVGWIFTDLDPKKNGKVAYKRHIETFFLSAEECITSGHYQNRYPNISKLASSGYFGSKFVTVCVSGDDQQKIHLTGYQVSNQCMALVRDNCLVPTLDAPELGYIRDSSQEQYVPDVFYKTKNEYGHEITKLARPLPVEYLLVEVTTTTPLEPCPYLPGGLNGEPFPIENREFSHSKPDFHHVASYYNAQHTKDFQRTMSDFHLLLYLYKCDVVPMRVPVLELCELIKVSNVSAIVKWRLKDHWSTVEQLIKATEPSPAIEGRQPVYPTNHMDVGGWSCPQCTFHNQPNDTECAICTLPRT